jgi:molybdopterin molybdotransferase
MPQPLVPVTEARQRVIERAPRLATERVAIEDALDRVLADDLLAAGDTPPFPCSAMDGYAVGPGPAGRRLVVVAESRAGTPAQVALRDGQAIRISTGAAVPAGAAAVIRQEDVRENSGRIETMVATAEGENVRRAGEDMRSGATVLRAGMLVRPAQLGAAVAAGAADMLVTDQPRVTVVCTGDELRAPGEPLGPGEIHNSNQPMLEALARRCGARVERGQRLPDDRAATEAGLADGLERSEVVVVSGGVSVGPHDHVKPALQQLGVSEVFWGVALQPGKPTWFGVVDHKLVFGLPGNPVSAVVTFTLFVRAALAAMLGARPSDNGFPNEAVLGTTVRRNRAREQALRVRLEQRDLHPIAIPNGPQGSHIVTSLLGADALAMIPPGDGELTAGTTVALEHLVR